MTNYYVNKNAQPNGDHEVHCEGCSYMPALDNIIFLGTFNNCQMAVIEAKRYYSSADGCYFCSHNCHKS